MPVEVAVIILAGIGELIVAVAGIAWAARKFRVERVGIEASALDETASANLNLAQAGKEWLDNYNRLFTTLQERDTNIANLNQRLSAVEAEQRATKRRLKIERQRRIKAETERDQTRSELATLKAEVERLRAELAELKQDKSAQPYL